MDEREIFFAYMEGLHDAKWLYRHQPYAQWSYRAQKVYDMFNIYFRERYGRELLYAHLEAYFKDYYEIFVNNPKYNVKSNSESPQLYGKKGKGYF